MEETGDNDNALQLDYSMTSEGGDSEPHPPYWDRASTIVLATLLIIFMSLAVVGNSMVIIVIFKHKGMQTRTNLFLCSLAIADLLCGILDMPFSLVTIIKGSWIFSDTFCQFNGFAMVFFFVASTHTLMYISIHKYISIRHPFSDVLTRRRVYIMIFAAWIWAGLAGYLTIHGLNYVYYKANTAQCGPSYPHDPRTYAHVVFFIATCYLTPLIVMGFCYFSVFKDIRLHSERLEESTTTEKDVIFMQQRRITVTLILVLLVFIFSWTPFIVYCIYSSAIADKSSIPALVNPISYWFGYMNSACNPIIYALRSPAFRQGYKQLLCRGTKDLLGDGATRSYPGPLGRFRTFLKETLPKSLYTQSSTEKLVYETGSKNSSLSSLANFLLFPKSRSLSTTSLPGNFKFSVNNIDTIDLTKVSFVAGIPVLMKRGKVVAFQNPNETPRRARTTPVFYPESYYQQRNQGEGKSAPKVVPPVEEASPLIEELKSESTSEQNVFLEVKPEASMQKRMSSESGFEDDAIFFVSAQVEKQPESPKGSAEFNIDANYLVPPDNRRMRKSVSFTDDEDVDREDTLNLSDCVAKSSSDTCLQAPAGFPKTSSEQSLRKSPRLSLRKRFITRLFSRKKWNGSKRDSPEPEIEEPVQSDGESGLVSGEYPSQTYDRPALCSITEDKEASKQQASSSYIQEPLSPRHLREYVAKASSDTCLEKSAPTLRIDSESQEPSPMKRKSGKSSILKHYKPSKKRNHQCSHNNKNIQGVIPQSPQHTELTRSISEKQKIKRYPSVERLDFVLSRQRCQSDGPQRRRNKCRRTKEFVFEENKEAVIEGSINSSDDVADSKGIKTLHRSLNRSVSDPLLTFRVVEEKAVNRIRSKKSTFCSSQTNSSLLPHRHMATSSSASPFPDVRIRIYGEEESIDSPETQSSLSQCDGLSDSPIVSYLHHADDRTDPAPDAERTRSESMQAESRCESFTSPAVYNIDTPSDTSNVHTKNITTKLASDKPEPPHEMECFVVEKYKESGQDKRSLSKSTGSLPTRHYSSDLPPRESSVGPKESENASTVRAARSVPCTPYKRWSFVGYGTQGNGSEKETSL